MARPCCSYGKFGFDGRSLIVIAEPAVHQASARRPGLDRLVRGKPSSFAIRFTEPMWRPSSLAIPEAVRFWRASVAKWLTWSSVHSLGLGSFIVVRWAIAY